eukprot:scaffold33094_cov63-Phaeocystis_antarctica.AAC.1
MARASSHSPRRTPQRNAPRPRRGRTGSPAAWQRPSARRPPPCNVSSSRSHRAPERSQPVSHREAWARVAATAARAAAAAGSAR